MLAAREKLLTVEDYARVHGISTETVKACIRENVLPVRSHNGKTYVVNIPLSDLLQDSESSQALASDLKTQQPQPEIPPGSIASLVEKMTRKAAEIKNIIEQQKEKQS